VVTKLSALSGRVHGGAVIAFNRAGVAPLIGIGSNFHPHYLISLQSLQGSVQHSILVKLSSKIYHKKD
jgi:hypothetical protein